MPPRTGSSRRRHTSLESFDTAALHRFSRVGRFTALRKTWEKRCSARVNPNASPDGKHASQNSDVPCLLVQRVARLRGINGLLTE